MGDCHLLAIFINIKSVRHAALVSCLCLFIASVYMPIIEIQATVMKTFMHKASYILYYRTDFGSTHLSNTYPCAHL